MVLNERGADTQALLLRAAGDETDGRDTVVHQLVSQLAASHATIANGEVETVGHGLVAILVVDDVEAVTAEDFLQLVGPRGRCRRR